MNNEYLYCCKTLENEHGLYFIKGKKYLITWKSRDSKWFELIDENGRLHEICSLGWLKYFKNNIELRINKLDKILNENEKN